MAGDSFVAAPSRMLRCTPLGALTAIYHRTSGQTHVVSEPVPAILEALARPCSLAALTQRLGLEPEDSVALRIRLEELEAVGLIERA